MKVLYIGIFKNETKESCREIAAETELSSYSRFTRGTIAGFLTFGAGPLAGVTQPKTRHILPFRRDESDKTSEPEYIYYSWGHSAGICGIVATDKEYPAHVAQSLAGKVVNEFANKYPRTAYVDLAKEQNLPMPELKDYITKYQDPAQADNVTKIQKELDETKAVLHKTIESVLERGEKIDDLVAKSDGLSASSKMFYTQAKKQNSCCNVM